MGFIGTIQSGVDKFLGLFGYMRASAETRQTSARLRQTIYRVNEAMYDNSAYEPAEAGGYAEYILKHYFGISKPVPGFAGYFNPVQEIVEAYQNCLAGDWGQELRPIAIRADDELHPSLVAALDRVWRDSNLSTEKQSMQRWAANLGTVGLRIVTYPGKVAIQMDHPGRLYHVEEDSERNVTGVTLKYTIMQNVGSRTEPHYEPAEVVEVITKEERSQTINGDQQIPDDDRRLSFGFCPYVILRHKDNGTVFGDWAYKGSERLFHRLNYRIARHDVAIDRNLFPKWFATAGGKKPEMMDLAGDLLTYVQSQQGTPPPSLEALVAKLQHSEVMDFWMELRDMLRGRQPELTINDVKLIANVSAEALERVLSPAKAVIGNARPNYDHALTRAMQMAVSVGIDTGTLAVEGAKTGDDAYKANKLAFKLADRPILPQTTAERLDQVKLDDAPAMSKATLASQYKSLGVDKVTVLTTAGFSKKEAETMLNRAAELDITEGNDL